MVRQLLPIVALLGSMIFLMLGGGLHGVIIPIRGQIEGFSTFELGWIGTGWAVGFTLGCIAVPHLVRRAGHVRTFSTLTALLSTTILLNGLVVDSTFWILLRAISGFCFSGCYMVAESWLNERVTNENRGTMFSLYMIVTQLAMMAGQFLLVTADPKSETLFMFGAVLFALAVVPTAVSTARSPAPLTHVSLNLRKLYFNSPAAAVGAVLSGVIASAWGNFAPVFGQLSGFSSANIATLLAAAMIGSILFQYPIGKLSDIIDRRYVMAIAGMMGIAFGSLMTVLARDGEFGTIFFISVIGYGAVIYSIYSLVVAHANDFANDSEFVEISSGLLILFGCGTMIGPLMTAQLMNMVGPSGVFTTTTLAHLVFASYAIYRTFRRAKPDEDERNDFQFMAMTKSPTPESASLDPRSVQDVFVLEEEDGLPPMLPPVKVEE